jgi:hypothetical protein
MTEQETSTRGPTRVRMALYVAAAVLLWLLGWWMGRSGPMAELVTVNERLTTVQAQADAGEKARAKIVAAGNLLESHIALLQTINELDQRNFGLAESHLQAARQWLAKTDAAEAGIDAAALAALKQELDATSLAVAVDLNVQRNALLSIEAKFRALSTEP